jgi:hypothetical protein
MFLSGYKIGGEYDYCEDEIRAIMYKLKYDYCEDEIRAIMYKLKYDYCEDFIREYYK